MPTQSIMIILIASMIGAFVLLLVGLIAGLSILRQQRLWRAHRLETQQLRRPDLTVALSQLDTPGSTNRAGLRPRSTVTKDEAQKTQEIIAAKRPKRHRLPVGAAQPDSVVIQIESDKLFDDQHNVQRLVDYLQRELERAQRAS